MPQSPAASERERERESVYVCGSLGVCVCVFYRFGSECVCVCVCVFYKFGSELPNSQWKERNLISLSIELGL